MSTKRSGSSKESIIPSALLQEVLVSCHTAPKAKHLSTELLRPFAEFIPKRSVGVSIQLFEQSEELKVTNQIQWPEH